MRETAQQWNIHLKLTQVSITIIIFDKEALKSKTYHSDCLPLLTVPPMLWTGFGYFLLREINYFMQSKQTNMLVLHY